MLTSADAPDAELPYKLHDFGARGVSSDASAAIGGMAHLAVGPKSKADQEKMGVALSKLAAEDPSFTVSTDQESGQTILKGMGELHLDIKIDILKRTNEAEANIGAPQVAYRESITCKAEIDYTHEKQTGGTGQFAQRQAGVRTGRARHGLGCCTFSGPCRACAQG